MSTQPSPKAVRFPVADRDLLPWYEGYASDQGISLNAALIRGLRAHQQAVLRQQRRRDGRRPDAQQPRLESA
jgi:hypothetical protein